MQKKPVIIHFRRQPRASPQTIFSYKVHYEKERAKEILGIPQMMPGFNPKTSDMEEVYEWHLKQEEAIKKYILSHPDDFRIKNEADFDE